MRFFVCIFVLFLVACNSDKVLLSFGTVLDKQNYVLEADLDVLALSKDSSNNSENMRTKLRVESSLMQLEVYDDGAARYEMLVDSVDYSSNKRSVEELAYVEKYLKTQTFQYKIAANGSMDSIYPMEDFLAVEGVNELELPRLFAKIQPVLPSHKVSVGDSWERHHSFKNKDTWTVVYKTFRLEDIFYLDGLQLAKLSMGVRYKQQEEDAMIKIESSDFLVGEGTVLFDISNGQIFSVKLEFSGTLNVADKLNNAKIPELKMRQVLKLERRGENVSN